MFDALKELHAAGQVVVSSELTDTSGQLERLNAALADLPAPDPVLHSGLELALIERGGIFREQFARARSAVKLAGKATFSPEKQAYLADAIETSHIIDTMLWDLIEEGSR